MGLLLITFCTNLINRRDTLNFISFLQLSPLINLLLTITLNNHLTSTLNLTLHPPLPFNPTHLFPLHLFTVHNLEHCTLLSILSYYKVIANDSILNFVDVVILDAGRQVLLGTD